MQLCLIVASKPNPPNHHPRWPWDPFRRHPHKRCSAHSKYYPPFKSEQPGKKENIHRLLNPRPPGDSDVSTPTHPLSRCYPGVTVMDLIISSTYSTQSTTRYLHLSKVKYVALTLLHKSTFLLWLLTPKKCTIKGTYLNT